MTVNTINCEVSEYTPWQYEVISIVNDPTSITPSAGNRYLIGTSPSGVWSTKANNIATYYNSTWLYDAPTTGWHVYVQDTTKLLVYITDTWYLEGINIETSAPINMRTGSSYVKNDATCLMYHYDATNSRNKWLAVRKYGMDFTGRGSQSANAYLNIDSNIASNNNSYYIQFNSTIIGYIVNISTTASANIIVRQNASAIITAAFTNGGAIFLNNQTLNIDLNAGDRIDCYVDAIVTSPIMELIIVRR